MSRALVHATAVAAGDRAVILRGPSGSGKSDLAFRLMALGAQLVSDDQVALEARGGRVYAYAPETVRGLFEVRGIGLLKLEPREGLAVRLVVDLVPREAVPRMPERETVELAGLALARLYLHAFDPSAPLKVLKALELVGRPDLLVE